MTSSEGMKKINVIESIGKNLSVDELTIAIKGLQRIKKDKLGNY